MQIRLLEIAQIELDDSMDAEILVIAVANLHRNPDYWKDRIKDLA